MALGLSDVSILAQSAALSALQRTPFRPTRVPLVHPRCVVATGGSSISSLYASVFRDELYLSPKPLNGAPRIVDAGGHLGLASLYFLHRYPRCTLTTIEPNPALLACLRQTLAPYAARATLLEAALSTETGTATFHVTSGNPLNVTGGLQNREAPDRPIESVRVSKLDARDVLREPVQLLKLDVEGHEYELLPLPLFEPNHIENMVIEFHDVDQRREEFCALLRLLVRDRGYRVANEELIELKLAEAERLTGCPVLKLF